MLLKLRQGNYIRRDKIESAKRELREGIVDMNQKLDRALDILIDELEAESAACTEQALSEPKSVKVYLNKNSLLARNHGLPFSA